MLFLACQNEQLVNNLHHLEVNFGTLSDLHHGYNEESRHSFDPCLMCYNQQLTNKYTYIDTVQKSKPV